MIERHCPHNIVRVDVILPRPLCVLVALGLLALVMATPGRAQMQQPARSCAATIRAVLDDIARRDLDTSEGPPRNAFLALNPSAIAQAEHLDREAASGRAKGPLFCVPVAVKDNFATADMPTTVGSLALVGNRPPNDAAIVAKLRRAGAVIIGKTNLDEFAIGVRGLSGAGGRVGNAYDPWQSAGGSSAGSGVAVGSGFVPLAVGSDGCGSLRIPAVYNGALSLRPTYGRIATGGMFPIGLGTGTAGLIASDTSMLRAGLAVVADGWHTERAAAPSALTGKRIALVRHLHGRDIWAAADTGTQAVFAAAIALMRSAGATVVEVDLDRFDDRLGPEFIQGFGRRVDSILARYRGPRQSWREICTSGRVMPEWSLKDCLRLSSASPTLERLAALRVSNNQRYLTKLLDRMRLDALAYPVDGRGAARADESDQITCMIAANARMPAVAFPIAIDERGLPIGLEFLGRARADETLVAMMAHFESARGPLPLPRYSPGRPELLSLSIAEQNNLRLTLGWKAFRSRRGKDIGALRPDRFRALTDETIRAWVR
jgi:Asp-tRNA(Asn)/Glu-tRNA(Gln) amidotransferase A subunit family amidase